MLFTSASETRGEMAKAMEHSGVLVVRAWIEDEESSGLRARITRSVGFDLDERVATATSIDEVCDEVRAWLSELLEAAEAGSAESGEAGGSETA
jgi:hypothetical protein